MSLLSLIIVYNVSVGYLRLSLLTVGISSSTTVRNNLPNLAPALPTVFIENPKTPPKPISSLSRSTINGGLLTVSITISSIFLPLMSPSNLITYYE